MSTALTRQVDLLLARLTRLPNVGGRGWKAICPLAEGDPDHVLKIDVGRRGEKLVIHCHGGCSTAAVLAAMHLRLSDLYPVRPIGRGRRGPAQSLAVKLAASGLSDGERTG
jgi:putative DNA primase/helicase